MSEMDAKVTFSGKEVTKEYINQTLISWIGF